MGRNDYQEPDGSKPLKRQSIAKFFKPKAAPGPGFQPAHFEGPLFPHIVRSMEGLLWILLMAIRAAAASGLTREAVAGKGAAARGGEEQKALVKDEAQASAAAAKEEPDDAQGGAVKEEEPAAAVEAEGAVKTEPLEEMKVDSLPAEPHLEEQVPTQADDQPCSQQGPEQQHDAGESKGAGAHSKKRGREAGAQSAQKDGSAAKKGKASPAGGRKGKGAAKGQSSLDSFVITNPA